jgi:hypothetical protein
MKLLLVLLPIFAIGQSIEYYNFGYGGIQRGLMHKNSNVIFCDSLARPLIMSEVMDSLVAKYKRNEIIPGLFCIDIKSAKVIGSIIIREKKTLKVIIYTYNKVIHSNGLTEIYRKPKKKKK